ncbi:hypothetical protein, partial [Phenylobacterium sp.]|uniref:hypothetical protein n=1 Tax=Phenylobacterium sp. TaxID=1871053 RepID=UPI002DE66FE0|nr:hypothetical protein [Phenylobacterium sp.]
EPIDPANLSGDELATWYGRTPEQVEADRQAAAQASYDAFFGNSQDASGSEATPQSPEPIPSSAPTLPIADQCVGPPLGQGGFLRPGNGNAPIATQAGAGNHGTPSPAAAPQQPLPPGIPPLPTFFSTMFGGPVPLHGPNGQVTGYYNHEAGRTGMNIVGAYAAVAPLFQPGGWMEAMPAEGGTVVTNAIREGIEEPIHMHHVFAKFLGGPEEQEREALKQSLHVGFHQALGRNLKEAGFLNVGGKGGSTEDWAAHFVEHPERFDQAIEILRRTSQDFDKTHGTSILPKLDRGLAKFRGQ